MNEKILVADDSSTIQKVINITLSNEPYDLIECGSEVELFKLVEKNSFQLILLDFNLSEEKTGYELSKMIKEKLPKCSILAMLGTFDTVDEEELKLAGLDDKIVKPFESSKFIKKCRDLLERSSEEQVSLQEELYQDEEVVNETIEKNDKESFEKEDLPKEDVVGDDWVVNSPEVIDNTSQEENTNDNSSAQPESSNKEALSTQNSLKEVIEGWGMSVPEVIGEKKKEEINIDVPPIISENYSRLEEEKQIDDDFKLPSSSDLSYPDLDDIAETADEELDRHRPTSKLVSIDQLKGEAEEENKQQETDQDIEDDIEEKKIEEEINLEQSPEDFWSADSDDATSLKDTAKIEEADQEIKFVDKLERVDVEEVVNKQTSEIEREKLDYDILAEKIKDKFTPILENMVKDFCKDTVEQVTWEIIPDLAENLIRKELKEISKSVQD